MNRPQHPGNLLDITIEQSTRKNLTRTPSSGPCGAPGFDIDYALHSGRRTVRLGSLVQTIQSVFLI
jgi:hypothetical protein